MVDSIIKKAHELKFLLKGINVIELIENIGIDINYFNLNPNVYVGYTTNIYSRPLININSKLTSKQKNIIAAHELGHAIFHHDNCYNQFDGDYPEQEYEANLFAVALLFNEQDFNTRFKDLSNYELKSILDYNLK